MVENQTRKADNDGRDATNVRFVCTHRSSSLGSSAPQTGRPAKRTWLRNTQSCLRGNCSAVRSQSKLMSGLFASPAVTDASARDPSRMHRNQAHSDAPRPGRRSCSRSQRPKASVVQPWLWRYPAHPVEEANDRSPRRRRSLSWPRAAHFEADLRAEGAEKGGGAVGTIAGAFRSGDCGRGRGSETFAEATSAALFPLCSRSLPAFSRRFANRALKATASRTSAHTPTLALDRTS